MINLSNVTAITHNNKDVTKIEDHLGNVIWQSGPTVKTKTITITVGAGSLSPDIPREHNIQRLQFPSLLEIKTYIYATYGETVQSFNSILFNKNSVYFKQNSSTSTTPYLNSVDSTTMTSPYTSGSLSTSTTVHAFGTGTWNITNYLNEDKSRIFYGYYRRSSTYTKFASGANYFCASDGTTSFTITLTISYNYLEDQGDWFTVFEGSRSISYPTAGSSATEFWWYFKPFPVGTQIRITYSFGGTYNKYIDTNQGSGNVTTPPSNPWTYTVETISSAAAYWVGDVYEQATNNTATCQCSYWVAKSVNAYYSYIYFTASTSSSYTRTYGPSMTVTKVELKLPE